MFNHNFEHLSLRVLFPLFLLEIQVHSRGKGVSSEFSLIRRTGILR
jgi:hypothetical protein